MHGVVENEREKRVKLVRRGIPVASVRISKHRDAFKFALVTAGVRGEKKRICLKYIVAVKADLLILRGTSNNPHFNLVNKSEITLQ